MAVWRFEVHANAVTYGRKRRQKLSEDGCNEPYKGRFWCPKKAWFRITPCPFENQTECDNYLKMCGCL